MDVAYVVWMEIPKYYISCDKNIKLLHMYFEAIGTEKEHVMCYTNACLSMGTYSLL